MIILTIRTDNPKAEVGIYDDKLELVYEIWEAHRELSTTIHSKIKQVLKSAKLDWPDIQGAVCFKGPGSFTGLRIGLTVANTIAATLKVPIVGSQGKDWVETGITSLLKGNNEQLVQANYGSPAHVTVPKK